MSKPKRKAECENLSQEGMCWHESCKHSKITKVYCVDVEDGKCEFGQDCTLECEFSYNNQDEKTKT